MFDTEREGFRDWRRYFTCLILGHRQRTDRGQAYCGRCHDVIVH